ncbi:tyrosine-type recombinase/integrase [Psychrobacillus psychrodurans]|uniref:tyrosine-type recombinase/integrase n=1 Tax=Psychrobacillus psychrodurans TaxID=126157 RepID=UPI003D06D9A7
MTQVNLRNLVQLDETAKFMKQGMTIEKALTILNRQMKVSGLRERTIKDYNLYIKQFCLITGVIYLSDITLEKIYDWLDSMNVSNTSKLIKLKSLKSILGKCFDNGWIETKFWTVIKIKVDKNVKKGAKRDEIDILLSLLDLDTFVGLRDAVAVLTMYTTGIRINTLEQIEETHIDIDNRMFTLDGSILKNHKLLQLPINENLTQLLQVLMQQNDNIRKKHRQSNNFLFITQQGTMLKSKSNNNTISKQLNKYSHEFGLENINAHAIRRGYAKKLLEAGASIAIISKALGHSNLAITTQYLDLNVEEVASSLREFL